MVRSVGLVARQSWFLPVVLVGISAVSSWEFACITPFVAFAAYGRVVSDDLHPRRTGCIHAGNRRPCRAAEPRMDSGSRRNL